MLVLCGFSSNRLLPSLCIAPNNSRSYETPKDWNPWGIRVLAPTTGSTTKSRICALQSKGASSFEAPRGTWEEPDDGSGSDYEDEEQEQENDLDFESDWEEEGLPAVAVAVASVTKFKFPSTQYEEDLLNEVEQLLGSEEKAILQQNEAPVLRKISTEKWSPLHTLALSGQINFMDKLLEQGVDIDAVDRFGEQDGFTALHKAVIGKKEVVISHLLRKGANPHIRDRNGATPLHYAVQVGAMQTVKLLIKYKVDVNVADNEGWTPLHVAIQSRCRDIAKVLLVNGADKNRRNKDGKTPLDLSLCYGKDFKSYDLAKLLKLVPADGDF
ncbi:PREDICTED: ankyrin repeat domain-containing protein EMB506, chloroplastic isoform X3 [Nelumbo nucifera]|uniref:Ankyrin repeat domain-containing protein EMB506, chloroplastic isoform X3 n=1 Tax=Nelumbo nucifera TaxID=4432 RepID=A0A1U8AZ32_NELNU|nr:PREDICTED: ankyrin repeat domain-containing protein EMB506, chloroplastic isoform X3 [Nelumbo nucifera]